MVARMRHAQRWLRSREGLLFIGLIVGALVVRLPLLPFHGYYNDLGTYVAWGQRVLRDVTTLYTVNGGGFGGPGGGFGAQGVNYPPGTPLLFAGLNALVDGTLGAALHTTLAQAVRNDGIGPFFAKLPIALADVGAVALLYWEARRRHSARFAASIAAAYALSPAVLYDGAVWGQTDTLVALPLLVAVFALIEERPISAGVALAVALLLKPQPSIFVPLMVVYLWRSGGAVRLWRFGGAALVILLVGAVPILVPQMQLGAMLHNMQATTAGATVSLTSDAFNFWWAAGYGQQNQSATFIGLNSALVGELCFGLVMVYLAVRLWQRADALTLCFGLAMQMFAGFLFLAGQHERYLFLCLPLMLVAVVVAPRPQVKALATLYALCTMLCLLNMLVGVGGGTFASSEVIPFVASPGLSSFISANFEALAMLLAFAHLAVFGYGVYLFEQRARASIILKPSFSLPA